MSVDRKSLCPNCGASLSGLEIKCPECGYVLTSETSASKGTTESILSLQEKLIAVDKGFSFERSSKKKASIINSYPIPNTAEALIRLLHFSYSNFEASKESGDHKLSLAWLGKAVESYRRLIEYKNDPLVLGSIDQYKILGEKKAFAKLSGSRKKKRFIILVFFLIVTLVCAFILCFDWGSYFIRRGKVDAVVSYYNSHGKKQKALEALLENRKYEEAARQMFVSGNMVDAVSLLAKNRLIKEALIMAAETNNPDTIHSCIDKVSKYTIINSRTKYYLDNNMFERDNHKTLLYDNDETEYKEIIDRTDSSVLWTDCWDLIKNLSRPNPKVILYSPFLKMYSSTDCRNWPRPIIKKDKWNRIENVLFTSGIHSNADDGNKTNHSDLVSYEFEYDNTRLNREKLLLNGDYAIDVAYMYHEGTDLLKAVDCIFFFLLDKAPFVKDTLEYLSSLGIEYHSLSYTDEYSYADGKLMEIKRRRISSGEVYTFVSFEYFENMCFSSVYSKKDVDFREVDFKDVSIFCEGKIIEKFKISLHGNGEVSSLGSSIENPENKQESIPLSENNNYESRETETYAKKDQANSSDITVNAPLEKEDLPAQKDKMVTVGGLSVTAPNWVQVGEQFNTVFSSKDKLSDFEFPNPDGFNLVWGPQKATSTSSVNGKAETVTSYTFILLATAPGIYSLSAKAKLHDQEVLFPKVNVKVVQ